MSGASADPPPARRPKMTWKTLAEWTVPFGGRVVSSLAAGLILAVLFFMWREYVVQNIDGTWYCMTKTTENSVIDSYTGMRLGWQLSLAANSNGSVSGATEKTWEWPSRGKLTGKDIDPGRLGGSLRYNLFFTSQLSLLIDLVPRREGVRPSIMFQYLEVHGDELRGSFFWSVDSQQGPVKCRRERVDWNADPRRGSRSILPGGRPAVNTAVSLRVSLAARIESGSGSRPCLGVWLALERLCR